MDEENTETADDFSREFFERAQAGEAAQKFLQLANQSDCGLIQSLLQSAGIPSYTDFTHINKFYGPLVTATSTGFSITLQILVRDYDDALLIVKDYIENKRKNMPEQNRLRSAAETAGSSLFSVPLVRPEQFCGITVYPLNTKA